MKTNQNLIRKMGGFEVIQRTSDGMFHATSLLTQWNSSNCGNKKEIGDYFRTQQTNEFLSALESEDEFKDGNSPYLKSRGKYNGGTWMHPLLFIDFAMWLNPTFKVKVLKFVYDELIKYRNEAGDAYRDMAAAVQKIVPKKEMPIRISQVAKAINYIVYNSHESEIRNKQAEENKVKELAQIEKDIAMLVNRGFIKTFDSLIKHLRDIWREKYMPKELSF